MYIWQGGVMTGAGVADVLFGRVSPSGHLADTIAYAASDYPADANFGSPVRNIYSEDIYVGYRHFETAAKERVRFPFGFGLSCSAMYRLRRVRSESPRACLRDI